jgi:NAD(P)H-dependent FMN reductase
LPLYDGDLEAAEGVPPAALALKRLFGGHAGIFIACPEYNASVTPLLKNTLDWVSRVREDGEPPLAAYKGRVFAIGSASPGAFGGFRAQMALRQVLEIGLGALVLPDGVAVPEAHKAFAEDGTLANPRSAAALTALAARLVAAARAPL